MNAELQQSDEETRDKLAQGLQSMFSHPEQFFEKRAMDSAFQMMANEMQSAFKSSSPAGGIMQYLFGMGPEMSTSTNPLDAMESALGMGGHGHAGTAGVSTSMAGPASNGSLQFQQGVSTFSAGSSTFSTAVAQFASAVSTSGGMGAGSMGSAPGMAGMGSGAISTASGAGAGPGASPAGGASSAAGGSSIMSGLAGASTGLSTLDAFGNALALPGMAGATPLLGADASATASLNAGGALDPLGGGASGASGTSPLSAISGIAGGGLMAATSIFSAYQNSNPIAGAMGGAMGGMSMGAAIGSIVPGIGTVVGGAIGAIAGGVGGLLAGIFGDQGRSQAEALDVNTIQPALAADMKQYEAGSAGYNTLATQLNSMMISAQNETNQMGSGARSYFASNIQPEFQTVLSALQKQEIGGRSAVTLSAAQYHSGGWTGDFGDLATSETEGFIHAAQNEFVVNPMAASAHAPILQAMNSGTNFAYSNTVQPRMPASSIGNGTQITIQALDSKSVAQWAKAGGGLDLMAALNQAQRQYSGVGRG
jgi:hypothetical protein